MADLPYSIVDGYGSVFEQKLGNHDQGKLLQTTINVEENTVINGLRTVKIRRNNIGVNPDFYCSFSPENPNIPILAVGNTPGFKYHKFRETNNLFLSAIEGNTCICDVGKRWFNKWFGVFKICRPEHMEIYFRIIIRVVLLKHIREVYHVVIIRMFYSMRIKFNPSIK